MPQRNKGSKVNWFSWLTKKQKKNSQVNDINTLMEIGRNLIEQQKKLVHGKVNKNQRDAKLDI